MIINYYTMYFFKYIAFLKLKLYNNYEIYIYVGDKIMESKKNTKIIIFVATLLSAAIIISFSYTFISANNVTPEATVAMSEQTQKIEENKEKIENYDEILKRLEKLEEKVEELETSNNQYLGKNEELKKSQNVQKNQANSSFDTTNIDTSIKNNTDKIGELISKITETNNKVNDLNTKINNLGTNNNTSEDDYLKKIVGTWESVDYTQKYNPSSGNYEKSEPMYGIQKIIINEDGTFWLKVRTNLLKPEITETYTGKVIENSLIVSDNLWFDIKLLNNGSQLILQTNELDFGFSYKTGPSWFFNKSN